MPRKRQTTVGRVNPVDVRSKGQLGSLEQLLVTGPITIVLVYADWCGHCQTFKQNMWNEVSQMPNKTVNTASVHYDMIDKTSLKNAKIDGYPSLLLVGTDKKPATFTTEGVKTNAMPAPENKEELMNMVNTPIASPVQNANAIATTIVQNANSTVKNTTVNTNTVSNSTNNIFTARNSTTVNSFTPQSADTLAVPDPSVDISRNTVRTEIERRGQQGGQQGGNPSLLSTLLKITQEAGHVGGLFLAATEYNDLRKRFTRRSTKRSKKTAKRKQRR